MLLNLIFQDTSLQDKFLTIVAYVVTIYLAIVLHEVGHGYVAHLNGDDTAMVNGRLSLNPLRHLDPLGCAMMLLVGMGWARPVPVDPNNFRDYKKGMVTVSLAGVGVNLILAIVNFCLLLGMGAIRFKVEIVSDIAVIAVKLFYYLGLYGTLINVSLIAFNLLPIAPLDGFRLVETLSPPGNEYVKFMYKYSRYVFLLLIALDIIGDRTGLPCNILSMYIGVIQDAVLSLIRLILGIG